MYILAVQVPTTYVQGDLCMQLAKRSTSLKSSYFFAVGLSSVKMIVDRHRHVAYHNKH